MSNEELAVQAQQGDTTAIADLWERVYRLIFWLMTRLYWKYTDVCASAGVTLEDLHQEGYFALLAAVKAFDPVRGYRFLAYLRHHCMNVFLSAAGLRLTIQRKSPLNHADRLERSIGGEDEDLYLLDMIPDLAAEQKFLDVERETYRQQLRDALDDCIAQLTAEQQRAIHGRYYEGQTLQAIAEREGVSLALIRQRERKALNELRKSRHTRKLRSFVWYDIVDRYAYRGRYQTFLNNRASSVEIIVEKLDGLGKDISKIRKNS